MRELAVALVVSLAVLLAGGIAWKADATTWRWGTLNLPGSRRIIRRSRRLPASAGGGIARQDSLGAADRRVAGAGPASSPAASSKPLNFRGRRVSRRPRPFRARLSGLPSPANSPSLASGCARITPNPGLQHGTGLSSYWRSRL